MEPPAVQSAVEGRWTKPVCVLCPYHTRHALARRINKDEKSAGAEAIGFIVSSTQDAKMEIPVKLLRQFQSANKRIFGSCGMRKLLLSLVLLIATIALYSPVHRHEFVLYDDQQYVTGNTNIQNGVNWETVKWAFTSKRGGNWHPLTWLSHALDCQFFLIDSAAHHDVNLVFYVCNVLLLFWVLLQSTGFIGRSFMVAALFALHPINVESVAWVAERKNLLSMLFFLLALGAYRWYARQPTTGRVLLVAFLYALGLM